MFDFDEIDLNDYFFTYHTESHINSAYRQYLEETEQVYDSVKKTKFIFEYVKSEILQGYRKYAEHEQEWGRLKWYAEELEKQYNKNAEIPIETLIQKAYILYDQALLLEKQGFPIPNQR